MPNFSVGLKCPVGATASQIQGINSAVLASHKDFTLVDDRLRSRLRRARISKGPLYFQCWDVR